MTTIRSCRKKLKMLSGHLIVKSLGFDSYDCIPGKVDSYNVVPADEFGLEHLGLGTLGLTANMFI